MSDPSVTQMPCWSISRTGDTPLHRLMLHPDCQQYWETYDKYGLWKEHTIMAHCVHSDRRECDAMRRAGVEIGRAHV